MLSQLDGEKCDKSGLDLDEEKRANKVITDTKKLGVPPFVRGSDIRSGNPKLNLMLCAEIFNNCPGLKPTEQELIEAAGLLNDDVGDSREERCKFFFIPLPPPPPPPDHSIFFYLL